MKTFKNEAFLKEFPFIEGLIDNSTDITVSRVDKDLLKKSFQNRSWDGSLGNDYDNYTVLFFSKDGKQLGSPSIGEYSGSNYSHSQTVDKDGESIIEAIYRLNIQNELHYIVVCNEGKSDWEGSEYREWDKLTIYKPPKNFTINNFIKELQQEAQREVLKETDF